MRFKFHAVGTDSGGNEMDFTIPMMFLSQTAQGDVRTGRHRQLQQQQHDKGHGRPQRAGSRPQGSFAERDPALPTDNTQLVTRTLTFALHNEAPRLLKAEVNIPQVQELLGTDAPTTIRSTRATSTAGSMRATGVFAEIVRDTPAAGDPFAGRDARQRSA